MVVDIKRSPNANLFMTICKKVVTGEMPNVSLQ